MVEMTAKKPRRVWVALVFAILLIVNISRMREETLRAPGCALNPPSRDLQNHAAPNEQVLAGSFTGDENAPLDWSRFAYMQYATDLVHLCSSLMIFESLHRLHSKPDRLLLYPSHIDVEDEVNQEAKLLRKARDDYGVKLAPVKLQTRAGADSTWRGSFTKLLAFNQTQYDRVLSLDSDATVLQPMDELFLLPSAPVAMPRAYWIDSQPRTLGSHVLLVEPSEFEFDRVMEGKRKARENEYDMEIINKLYRDNAMVIPHRQYGLLTGEFRSRSHAAYLGSKEARFEPDKVIQEAKYVHFSDWPVPKPFNGVSKETIEKHQPKCMKDYLSNTRDCRARDIWVSLYADYAERKEAICGALEPLQRGSLE